MDLPATPATPASPSSPPPPPTPASVASGEPGTGRTERTKRTDRVFNLIGWYGVLAILLAYFLNSYWKNGAEKKGSTLEEFVYQVLNLTGGLGVALVSLRKKAWPPTVLNIVWAAIALMALLRKPA